MGRTIKNIFISHVHEDDDKVSELKELLKGRSYEVRDSSIDSSNPNRASDENYIKSQILGPRIKWAGVMIVLVSSNTHKSQWVDWEIEYAEKNGKRIIGVLCLDAKDSDLPKNLDKYRDCLVSWRRNKIIDAIDRGADIEEDPEDGNGAYRRIPRYKC